jgi:dolichol-phosphate mannosyltransferase
MTASVILPTYNERETIVALVGEILSAVPDADVLVVDDDSPDLTWAIIEQTFAGDSRVRVLRRIGRRSLSSALAEGTNQAKGDAVVWLDADGSMPATAIPALLAGLTGADVVVGSRYATGGRDARTSRLRVGTSWLINAFAALLLSGGVRDYTSGFIAARRSVLERVPIRTDYVYGEYCIDFLYRAAQAGVRVREIPYRCGERRGGETKTAPDIARFVRLGLAYVIAIVKLRLR